MLDSAVDQAPALALVVDQAPVLHLAVDRTPALALVVDRAPMLDSAVDHQAPVLALVVEPMAWVPVASLTASKVSGLFPVYG